MANNVCDICGHEDESKVGEVVHRCEDGVYRCKLCRQRREFGRTFWRDEDEVEAAIRGERRPIWPIENDPTVAELDAAA